MNDYDYIYLMKEQLNKHEDIELTIYGKSMLPTIADGQKIKIRLAENLKIGDIIAYYLPNKEKIRIIVHRVIFLRESYVLTKGDNNNFIDPVKITRDKIIGRVI